MNVLAATIRLGSDADLRFTPENTAVAQFNGALQSGYGKNAKTTWLRCTVWGKKAEAVAPMLLKGTQIAITGEITLNEYQDKQGQTKSSLECRIQDVTLLGKRDNELKPAGEPKKADGFQPDPFDEIENDIPF
jgi:single-strand DNA-binding protein